MKREKITTLNALRFVAIFLVFLNHCDFFIGTVWQWIYFTLSYGFIGLNFFFMLSGFLMSYTYQETFDNGVSASQWFSYIKKRITRIYPVYLVTMLICVPWVIYKHGLEGMGLLATVKDVVVRLAFSLPLLQALIPYSNLANSFNGAAWFLSCIFILYLVTPTLLHLNQKIRHSVKKVITALVLDIVLFFVVYMIFHNLQYNIFPEADLSLVYTSPYIRVFIYVAGVLLCDLYCLTKDRFVSSVKRYTLVEGILCFVLLVWWLGATWMNFIPMPVKEVINTLLNLFVIYIFGVGKGWFSQKLNNKVILHLSDISFEFYLIHYPIIIIIGHFWKNTIGMTTVGSVAFFVLVLTLSLVLGEIAHRCTATKKIR